MTVAQRPGNAARPAANGRAQKPARVTRLPTEDIRLEVGLLSYAMAHPHLATGRACVEFAAAAPLDVWTNHFNGRVAAAIGKLHAAGDAIDGATVHATLSTDGQDFTQDHHRWFMQIWGEQDVGVQLDNGAAPAAATYPRLVAERASARWTANAAADLNDAAKRLDHDGMRRAMARLEEARQLAAGPTTGMASVELTAFLAEPEPEHDWAIPGLIERAERVIVTANEGAGKSTLLRQVAVQAAHGIHPFTLEAVEPIRVLLVDLENSRPHIRRKLRPLAHQAAAHGAAGGLLAIWPKPEGLDLTHHADASALRDQVALHKPDLITIGPLYKLHNGDPTEELPAKAVSAVLDLIRAQHGCAIMLEAHTPHASGANHRPERPYGASLWMRWPEVGIHIGLSGAVTNWRGQRDERGWPKALRRGGPWPWTEAREPPPNATPPEPSELHLAITALMEDEARSISGNGIRDAARKRGIKARNTDIDIAVVELVHAGVLINEGPGRGGGTYYRHRDADLKEF